MSENKHNLVKIKSLLFLRMRKHTKKAWCYAHEIAKGTQSNVDSLYVLLGRWKGWHLVDRLDSTPYAYKIASAGETYLNKLGNWYPGDVYEIAKEVSEASRLIFWWVIRHKGENYTLKFIG